MSQDPVSFSGVATSLNTDQVDLESPRDPSDVAKDAEKVVDERNFIEQAMFPDITGLPYSERKIFEVSVT